jgi:hypothetical protein
LVFGSAGPSADEISFEADPERLGVEGLIGTEKRGHAFPFIAGYVAVVASGTNFLEY